jgi:thiol-disulfide isomerase/thioredoxin/tetratricopeptide (TPR) repeat protein
MKKITISIMELGQKHFRSLLAFVACLVLGVAFISPAAAQETTYPCSTPPDILQEFQKLDFPNDMAMTAKERAEKSQKIFDALFAKYPDNFFVQRRYQDDKRNAIRAAGGDFDPMVKEYQALLAKHPDDPRYLYLYARALFDTKPQEAISYHEKALQLAPNFPWPHLQLATIYAYGGHDLAKRQTHLEAFMKMCPSSLEVYKYMTNMENKEFLHQAAAQLRKALEGRTDSDALEAYDSLWKVEFRGSPPSEYQAVRERQAADLARLRGLNLENSLKWYQTLNSGYETLGDTQGQKWVEDQLLQNFPQSRQTFWMVSQRWYREHPYPPAGSPPEKLEAYNQALLSATTEWIRLWPQAPMPWMSRFQAVTHLKDVSDADVEAAADGYMAVEAKNPDAIMPASMSIAVAEVYVKRGIRLASVPQLVESGIEQAQKQTQQAAHTAGMPPEYQQMALDMMNSTRYQGWSILVDYDVKTNQPDKARDILVKMGTFLSEHKPGESAKPLAKLTYTGQSRIYWEKMASLAEAQNRKMDAMGYYLNALDIPRQQYRVSEKEDETAQKARQLWKALGGTDEGWSVWTSEHAPPATLATGFFPWNKLNKPLPDFSLPDLSGRTWRLQDLKGKVTFVNAWATWCGPCQTEMPSVQKLYEKMKGNPDVQVLTLNIDENPGLIAPYLQNTNYTFPIIPATSLFVQIDQFMAIPRNWVVDANGVLRREQLGFGNKDEEWLKNATQALEEVRNGK